MKLVFIGKVEFVEPVKGEKFRQMEEILNQIEKTRLIKELNVRKLMELDEGN